jgi:hypothetical protein
MGSSIVHIHPITLKKANEFVLNHHRHHKPTIGHKWSIGLMHDAEIVGVAIVGRSVSRHLDDGLTAEVTRLATNGIANGCSMLYGACARVARAMGYCKIQTYILDSELGISLKASGWELEALSPGGQWVRNDGIVNRTDQPTEPKQRWVKYL